jgi:hypothetical protein
MLDFARADLRIRIVRRRLQGVRWEIHPAPAAFRRAADELPGVQEAGAKDYFVFQFPVETEAALDLGRQKGGFYRAQEGQQGGVREAMIYRGRPLENQP